MLKGMKQVLIAAATALPLTAAPLAAQDLPEAEAETSEGFSLMEEGAKLIFRGLLDEMGPALDEMEGFADDVQPALRQFAEEMGPALARLMHLVDEVGNYAPPEVLPNGDIIIRRRDDAPPYVAPEDRTDGGEIEL